MKRLAFVQKIAFIVNLFFAFCLFLACIVPYTNSVSLAFISLAVPLLVLINILFFVYWLLLRRFLLILPLSILILGYLTLGTFIRFNISNSNSNSNSNSSEKESLTIMSFNGLYFDGKSNFRNGTPGDSIIRFIKQENPDIVCFQEFDYKRIRTDDFKDYPFSYVDFDFHNYSNRVIQAIYSKYEILGKGNLEFPSTTNSAVFADILVANDTIRLYNLHLESLKIRPGSIKRERSDLLFGRLRKSFAKQQEQSNIVREHMNTSPYRNIVSGDFNNTQFSSVYLTIKGDLKDTFMEKGSGYGQTIKFWRFPFRIDFILVDPSIEVLCHKNYNLNLSDHEPVMASIKIGANK